jgi:hypothetical protein
LNSIDANILSASFTKDALHSVEQNPNTLFLKCRVSDTPAVTGIPHEGSFLFSTNAWSYDLVESAGIMAVAAGAGAGVWVLSLFESELQAAKNTTPMKNAFKLIDMVNDFILDNSKLAKIQTI